MRPETTARISSRPIQRNMIVLCNYCDNRSAKFNHSKYPTEARIAHAKLKKELCSHFIAFASPCCFAVFPSASAATKSKPNQRTKSLDKPSKRYRTARAKRPYATYVRGKLK